MPYRHTPFNRYKIRNADVGETIIVNFKCRCRWCKTRLFIAKAVEMLYRAFSFMITIVVLVWLFGVFLGTQH